MKANWTPIRRQLDAGWTPVGRRRAVIRCYLQFAHFEAPRANCTKVEFSLPSRLSSIARALKSALPTPLTCSANSNFGDIRHIAWSLWLERPKCCSATSSRQGVEALQRSDKLAQWTDRPGTFIVCKTAIVCMDHEVALISPWPPQIGTAAIYSISITEEA